MRSSRKIPAIQTCFTHASCQTSLCGARLLWRCADTAPDKIQLKTRVALRHARPPVQTAPWGMEACDEELGFELGLAPDRYAAGKPASHRRCASQAASCWRAQKSTACVKLRRAARTRNARALASSCAWPLLASAHPTKAPVF